MAWTTPKTWAFQEGVESSELNTHLRDNLLAVGPTITRLAKSADQSVAGTSYSDDTGLSFDIGASEIWICELHIQLNIDGSGDYKCTWTIPSGASGTRGGADLVPGGVQGWREGSLTTDHVAAATGSGAGFLEEYIRIVNSTTAGTVQHRFASFAGNAPTEYAGSWGIAYRIS